MTDEQLDRLNVKTVAILPRSTLMNMMTNIKSRKVKKEEYLELDHTDRRGQTDGRNDRRTDRRND